jgi:hypothetical protein
MDVAWVPGNRRPDGTTRSKTPRRSVSPGSRIAALALSVGVLAACASVPLPEREGVALYRRKCGACHRPYAPQEIRVSDFEKTLAVMTARAKLSAPEAAEIRRYLEPDLLPAHSVSSSAR